MTKIAVTMEGASTSPVIWVSMTPWVGSSIEQHVTVPGARGAGVTFRRGRDNAVATLQGRVPWTYDGESMLDSLIGAKLTIDNGVSVRTGIAGTPTVSGDSTAWIRFSLTVREV